MTYRVPWQRRQRGQYYVGRTAYVSHMQGWRVVFGLRVLAGVRVHREQLFHDRLRISAVLGGGELFRDHGPDGLEHHSALHASPHSALEL
jgi:hypothetical protein